MTHTFTRAKSTLSAINRALYALSDRSGLPSIEFIFSADDYTHGPQPIWTYSKRKEDTWAWLMPDFGYWSWPEVDAGSYSHVRQRIASIDNGDGRDNATSHNPSGQNNGLKFKDKRKQLLWRGNIATAPDLRQKLLSVTSNKPWSSTASVEWGEKHDNNIPNNFMSLEDHCNYMLLAHVEGRSYSGRGKYLQNCRSVLITHELEWREIHHAALVSSGPDANYVLVKRDFSDLEANVLRLLSDGEYAEVIAENSVRAFRDRYLTPAAEACYWRELIWAYGSLCDFEPVLYSNESSERGRRVRGVDFESFILNGELP